MSGLVSIEELLDNKYDFFIPSYQRGYRWGRLEAGALLDDLNEFFSKSLKDSDYYCMQPIVVANKGDNKYEVIDGQQRLTTFYILAKVLGIEKTYSISYETRAKSKEFLERLDTCDSASNIDFYYMKKVFEFFNNTKNKEILKNFKLDEKLDKIKIIWHEINANQIDYFLNLNANKTPLEEVELIKAKMINALSSQDEKQKLAKQWSEIESVLANDRFYYFIANNERKNRMSVLFEIIYEDKNIYEKYTEQSKLPNEQTKFDYIYNLFEKLKELYKDKETYHKIGYLAYFEDLKVFKGSDKNFDEYLNNINKNFDKYLDGFGIKNLSYFQPIELKKVFLYYEIKYHLGIENSYFRFDLFKNDSYDIEHIHPQSGEKELNDKQKEKFIELYNEIKQKELINNNNFDETYKKLTSEEFPNQDNIYNLCLLNSSINRSYGNLPFIMKKQVIDDCIELNKHHDDCIKSKKRYILEHCQLAFSSDGWSEGEANAYLNSLKDKIAEK